MVFALSNSQPAFQSGLRSSELQSFHKQRRYELLASYRGTSFAETQKLCLSASKPVKSRQTQPFEEPSVFFKTAASVDTSGGLTSISSKTSSVLRANRQDQRYKTLARYRGISLVEKRQMSSVQLQDTPRIQLLGKRKRSSDGGHENSDFPSAAKGPRLSEGTPQQKRPTMIRLKGRRKGTDSGPKNVSEPPKTASTIKSEQPRTPVIWMIGSSYIRRGEEAAQKQFGTNFGLRAKVQWFGKGGMRWGGVLPRFYSEARTHGPPDILVVHAGGNDLGLVSPVELASQIQKDLSHLHKDFPEMRIAFSAINERQSWRYGRPGRINSNRKQVNSLLRRAVRSFGGLVIEHPELRFFNNTLFLPDRVHFSKRGNSLFLGRIHSVLEKILAQRCNT